MARSFVLGAVLLIAPIVLLGCEDPAAVAGKECSNERINQLARTDPDRMKAEFRACVEDLSRRMNR